MSLTELQREARPNVNFNRVAVSAFFPGASPTDVEELIIDPIEEKIAEVDGIKEYRSVSFSGAGAISVEIDDTYPDVDEIIDEIRRKVGEVNDLPENVEDPFVTEIKAINLPVLRLALYGELAPLAMKLEVEKMKDYLNKLDGVQSVSYSGLNDLQLKIQANPQSLDKFDMTLIEMISSVGGWARQKPGGLFESEDEATNLTIGRDYSTIEALNDFVLRSNDSGQSVSLKDVAKISFDTEVSQKISSFAGENAVLMTIVKSPTADIVETVEGVKLALDSYKDSLPPELSYKLYTDESLRVRNSLTTVSTNALFGLFLVLVVLIINLDFRSAIVTSIGIPVAIIGGIAILYLLGSTMNTLVLIGMIVVLGMLVDDAIVVCENIYSHLEAGLSPVEAAIKGASEIAAPVVATVLTTVFAFFPILFMKGIMGQFISVIPLTVIVMLAVSILEALIILPVHASEIMKTRAKKKTSIFTLIEPKYTKYLNWSIRNRWLMLIIFIGIFGGSMAQMGNLFSRFTLFPATGLTGLNIRMEVARNTPIEKTAEVSNILSKRLEAISGGDFDSLYAEVGEVITGGAGGSRQNGSHLAQISIIFPSDSSFIEREKALVANIRQVCKDFSLEFDAKTSVSISRPGPPIGKPIQFQITGRDFEESKQVAERLKQSISTIDGVNSLETDVDGNTKKYRFIIDNNLAVAEGVDPTKISRTIFAASTGIVTSEILKNNEKVELLVGIADDPTRTVEQILDLRVRNRIGQAVPIKVFVSVNEELGPSSIQRLDGVRTITLFGEVDEKVTSGKLANDQIAPMVAELSKSFKSVKIETGGGERDRLETLKDTMRLYILAVLMIFMVISLSFNSLLYPFLVLLAIPFGLIGVVWSLTLHNTPLSLMGLIGVVGLSGVVVNVSIIMLSFIQEEIKKGRSLTEAIVRSGRRRLRPILITTLIGLLPSIYGAGGFDPFVQPIALVLGWGLAVATFFSVFFLPAFISFWTVLERKPSH